MATQDKKQRAARAARTSPAGAGDPQKAYVMFAVFSDQLLAIKQAAARMQAERGEGKADQSEVLRLALDAMATGGELPHGLKEALAVGVKERRQTARNGGRQ
jgi:hypothetical protein